MARDYTVVYKALADFSSLEKAAKKAERRLESLQKQADGFNDSFITSQKDVASALDDTSESYGRANHNLKLFCGNLKRCNETSKAAATSTRAQATELGRAEDQYDVLDRAVRRHEDATRRSTSATQGDTDAKRTNTRETDRSSTSTKKWSATVGEAGAKTTRLGSLLGSLGSRFARLTREQDNSTRSTKRSTASFQRLIGVTRSLGSVMATLSKFAVIGSLIGTATNAISALTAGVTALIGRLTTLTPLLAGIPGLLAGLLIPIGALVGGFAGVGDAVGAIIERNEELAATTAEAGKAAETAARRKAEAERRNASARRNAARAIQQAERGLVDAQEYALEAQENLNLAREAAVQYLDDLEDRLARQPLMEDRAAFNVDVARNELLQTIADPGSTALERRDAELNLAEAEQALIDLQNEGVEVEEELAEARADGVEGSDFVIEAQEALADAIQGVADAEYNLMEAQERQIEVNADIAESLDEVSTAQQKVEDAFRDLSPEAREFAQFIADLKPKLVEFRQAVQAELLPPLQRAIGTIVDALFPTLVDGFAATARSIGVVAEDLARRLAGDDIKTALEELFGYTAETTETFGIALNRVIEALIKLAAEGEPVVRWLADVADRWSQMFHDFVDLGAETGSLQRSMREAIGYAQQWGAIIADVWRTLAGVFRATDDAGQTLTDRIEAVTQRWSDWTNSVEGQNAIRDWAEAALPVITEITGLIGDLFRMFGRLAQSTDSTAFWQRIRADVVPAIERLLTALSGEFTDAVIDLVVAAADLLTIFAEQGGAIDAFLSTLNTIVDAVQWMLTNVPGLGTAFGVFGGIMGTVGALSLVFGGLVRKISSLIGFNWSGLSDNVIGAFAKIRVAASGAQFGIAGIGIAAAAVYTHFQNKGEDEWAANIVRGSEDSAEAIRRTADELVSLSDIADEGFQGELGDWFSFNLDADANVARGHMDGLRRQLQELAADPNLEEIISDPRARQDIIDAYNTMTTRIAELNVVAGEGGNVGRNAEIQIRQLTDAQADMAPVMDLVLADMNAYNAELRALTDELGAGTTPGFVQFSDTVAQVAADTGLTETALRRLVDGGLVPAEVHATEFADAEARLRAEAESVSTAIHDQMNAISALTDPVFRASEAQRRYAEAQAETQRLIAEGASPEEIAAAAQAEIRAVADMEAAYISLASADISLPDLSAEVARLQEQYGLSEEAARAMVETYAGVAGEAEMAFAEAFDVEPIPLPGVDNRELLLSIAQTGAEIQAAYGAMWEGASHDSWMRPVVDAADQGGQDTVRAVDPWMQRLIDSHANARTQVVDEVEAMGTEVTTEWGDITSVVDRTVGDHTGNLQSTYSTTHDALTRATRTGLGDMGAAWARHPAAVAGPVNDTIRGPLNSGLIVAWNHVAGTVGEPSLSPIPLVPGYNTGGIVDDPRYGTLGPNKDGVIVKLTGGEGVVNREATEANRSIIDAMNAGATFSMASTEGTIGGGGAANGPARFAGVAQGVRDGEGFNTSGLNKGRTNADAYDLAHARGNNPFAGTGNPGYLEGADHQGEGYSTRGFGGVKPWVAKAGHYIREQFGVRDIGGVGPRNNPSDHPSGHALDFMVYDDAAKGDAISEYLAANAGHFAVKYIIWWQHINRGSGWKPMGDRGSITANHYDHPHVSFLPEPNYESEATFASTMLGSDMEFTGAGSMGAFTEALAILDDAERGVNANLEGSGDMTWDKTTLLLTKNMLAATRARIESFRAAVSSHSGWTGGAGVEQWRGVAAQALDIMGQPQSHLGSTLRRMDQESSGNPTVVNKWDSNWDKGTPSVGLMQVIGPTYKANKHPGYDKGPYLYGTSVDPLANILASMRYALGRYGSLPAAYDKAGGYDQGGVITKGFNLMYSGLNDPEVVSPVPIMREAFRAELEAFTGGFLSGDGLAAPIQALSASVESMSANVVRLSETMVATTTTMESIGTNIEQFVVNNPVPERSTETLPRTVRKLAYLGG